MTKHRFFLSVMLLFLALPVIALSQQKKKGQASPVRKVPEFESKWGRELPALRDCLVLSEDTGAWGYVRKFEGMDELDHLIVFQRDGTFVVTWEDVERQVNRFGRVRINKTAVRRTGKWSLSHRAPTAEERKALVLPDDFSRQVYFLEFVLAGNKNATKYERTQEWELNGNVVLALDENPLETRLTKLAWVIVSASPKNNAFFNIPPEHQPGAEYLQRNLEHR